MSEGLMLSLLLVAIGAGIYITRAIYHGKRVKPSGADMTMRGAWDYWIKNKTELSDDNRRIVDLVQCKFADSAIEKMRNELFEIEEESKKATDPLVPLRRAIMDALDTSLLNEAIKNLDGEVRKKVEGKLGNLYTAEIILWGYLANEFKCSILRWYSLVKYDDASADDWFTYYVKITKGRARHIVGVLQRREPGKSDTTNAARALMGNVYDEQVMDKLRERLLKAPRKMSIPESVETEPGGGLDQWKW